MSLRKLIANLIPGFLLRRLLTARDRRDLSKVPTAQCDLTALRSAHQISIPELIYSEKAHEAWESVAETIDSFEIPDMTGGVNPGDRRAIFQLAISLKVKQVLEVGTHIGASTCHLAAAIRQNSQDSSDLATDDPRLVTVDIADVNNAEEQPWLEHGSRWSPFAMVEKLGCESLTTFQTSDSLSFLKTCKQKFDLIFLDGDHSAQTTYQEIPVALKLLKPDGVILLHDYFPELQPLWSNGAVISGPFLAAQRLIAENNAIKVLPLGALRWPTKLNSNLTSLAVLLKD